MSTASDISHITHLSAVVIGFAYLRYFWRWKDIRFSIRKYISEFGLTIQHQKGYHKLFKPFVKGMYKSNIIKAIGAHVAKHRTQHLKHIMFNSKPSLLGKIYNKILEPICYWVGKI